MKVHSLSALVTINTRRSPNRKGVIANRTEDVASRLDVMSVISSLFISMSPERNFSSFRRGWNHAPSEVHVCGAGQRGEFGLRSTRAESNSNDYAVRWWSLSGNDETLEARLFRSIGPTRNSEGQQEKKPVKLRIWWQVDLVQPANQ